MAWLVNCVDEVWMNWWRGKVGACRGFYLCVCACVCVRTGG